MRCERGDVILGGLARTAIGLLLFALVVYEVGAVAVNSLQLDSIGQDAARAAATAWSEEHRRSAAEGAAAATLAGHAGVSLDEVLVGDGRVSVTLSRPAQVLVSHRIAALRRFLVATVTKQAQAPSARG